MQGMHRIKEGGFVARELKNSSSNGWDLLFQGLSNGKSCTGTGIHDYKKNRKMAFGFSEI